MPEYLPSLAERKRRLIEDVCASCGGDGGGEAGEAMAEPGGDETTGTSTLMKALRTLKKKKRAK